MLALTKCNHSKHITSSSKQGMLRLNKNLQKRAPALLDNLAQAFLMAPYFVLLEVCSLQTERKKLHFLPFNFNYRLILFIFFKKTKKLFNSRMITQKFDILHSLFPCWKMWIKVKREIKLKGGSSESGTKIQGIEEIVLGFAGTSGIVRVWTVPGI